MRFLRTILVGSLLFLAVTNQVQAAVPSELTVQGVLRDSAGRLQTMSVTVIATLYGSATGGAAIAGPYMTNNVEVNNGLFTLTVRDPALRGRIGGSEEVWLEVTAGNDVFPRQKVTANLFALMASTAEQADGLSAACVGCVQDGMIAGVAASKVTGKVASAASADRVANGVYTNASYADPAFITSLDGVKITGKVAAAASADTVANGVYTNTSYADPAFITSLDGVKITGKVAACAVADSAATATTAANAAQLGGVAASAYQRALLPADCGVGSYIRGVATDGTVTCGNVPRFVAGTGSFSANSCNTPSEPCPIDISRGAFTKPPSCTISLFNVDGTNYTERMVIQSVTTTRLNLWKGTFPDAGTTINVSYICMEGN